MKYGNYSYQLGPGAGMPGIVKKLIMANVIVFFLQLMSRSGLSHIFGFVPAYFIGRFWIWQVVTYMFLHGSFSHIFINMFMLWMFGSDIERQWGEKEFLKYYFLTGMGAGILTFLTSPHSVIPTVGASGAIFGLLVAYAMMFPDRLLLIFFIFPMKAKHAVLLFGAIELFFGVSGVQTNIAHFAHLGGALVGFIYLKYWPRMVLRMGLFRGLGWRMEQWKKEKEHKEEVDFSDKVDAILDKINREGMESLTLREKDILRKYREKLK